MSTEVYLVRHGIAVEVGEAGAARDFDRMLSETGRTKTREVARALGGLGCHPVRIFSSPLVRARETAEIMQSELAPEGAVELAEELACGGHPAATVDMLRGLDAASVMLVGHMPDMAELAAALLTRDASLNIVFKKAAVCGISFTDRVDAGRGSLRWLLQPRQLKAML